MVNYRGRSVVGFTGFLLGFTWFDEVSSLFDGFYWVLVGFTGFFLGFTGFYRVLLASSTWMTHFHLLS